MTLRGHQHSNSRQTGHAMAEPQKGKGAKYTSCSDISRDFMLLPTTFSSSSSSSILLKHQSCGVKFVQIIKQWANYWPVMWGMRGGHDGSVCVWIHHMTYTWCSRPENKKLRAQWNTVWRAYGHEWHYQHTWYSCYQEYTSISFLF